MFTRTLRFGTYRTIVLDPQKPSFKQIAALVFQSAILTAHENWLFFLQLFAQSFTGTWSFGSYQTRVSSNFLLKKSQFYVSFNYLECRRKKTVLLLSVGSKVHQDTKIRYLSNDSFRSSTTFARKDDRFGVLLNKLDSRWKETVFLVIVGNSCTRAWGFGSYQLRVFNYFHLKKCDTFASSNDFESRYKTTFTLLIVGSYVPQETKIR